MSGNWGSFSPESYEAYAMGTPNPMNGMVVAPALASRAASHSHGYGGYEDEWGDESVDEGYEDEYETNAPMAMSQLRSMADDIMMILSELTPDEQLPAWVAAKITMSKQNLSAVADYLTYGQD